MKCLAFMLVVLLALPLILGVVGVIFEIEIPGMMCDIFGPMVIEDWETATPFPTITPSPGG